MDNVHKNRHFFMNTTFLASLYFLFKVVETAQHPLVHVERCHNGHTFLEVKI